MNNIIFSKMLEICASHLESLECYEDFPNISREEIDEVKEFIQALLRKLSRKYFKQ